MAYNLILNKHVIFSWLYVHVNEMQQNDDDLIPKNTVTKFQFFNAKLSKTIIFDCIEEPARQDLSVLS